MSFCMRMKLNEQIYAKKKSNGLYFYKGHIEVKKVNPIKFEFSWSKELKAICIKSKANLNLDSTLRTR